MMSFTFGLFTQVSGSGPLGPLVLFLGISKGKLFNSILYFAILSIFNARNVIIWH